jgi:hypothetical protein
MADLIPMERIESKIFVIRGQRVMIDRELAELYGVPTKALNQAVRRNKKRFPPDFAFQLNTKEKNELVTNCDHLIGLKYSYQQPLAFTEQGVAMLSSVLHSDKAIEVNVLIMRAFVRLRKVLAANRDLTYLFKELKHKVDRHDNEIGLIIRAIEKMIAVDTQPKRKIGFIVKEED